MSLLVHDHFTPEYFKLENYQNKWSQTLDELISKVHEIAWAFDR